MSVTKPSTPRSAPGALLVAATGCALAACRTTVPDADTGGDADVRAVERVLRAQESAWNRRDVAGFLELGYWRSPQLTFFSGGEDTRGFQPVYERYVARYAAPGQDPGRLAFTRLEILPLAAGLALARGRWDLDYADEPDVGGLFTLVVRELPEGWRIVHDHTSVDG
jgi:beta-aspartyl-peptidase (threonine type)